MFDYFSWRGDLRFSQSPFNPVDNIIFSQLSYLPMDGIVPGLDSDETISIGEAAAILGKRLKRKSDSLHRQLIFKDDPGFISAIGSSERFKHCGLAGYVNHIDISSEKQFSVVSVIIDKTSSFIAFRGTDANIIGWKEDLNMGFSEVIPSQLEAVEYLETMAKKIKGPLRLGGHSKGGNLAVYAAAFCRAMTRRRIRAIYSNDAPGFHRKVIESKGFAEIRGRIQSFVPQSSVVGMLLEHGDDYTVIKSAQTGIMQHELYSWEVSHNDMIRLDEVSQGSRFLDKTLREWINGLDYEHRQQFADALYTILSATQAKSFPELSKDWFKSVGLMLQSLKNIDESTRTLMGKTLAALFRAARNNINTLLPPTGKKP